MEHYMSKIKRFFSGGGGVNTIYQVYMFISDRHHWHGKLQAPTGNVRIGLLVNDNINHSTM